MLSGTYDATWIFTNWEGVHAEAKGVKLRLFKMADHGIPYGYSPVLMADKECVAKNEDLFKKFLAATKAGFLYAQNHPDFAVTSLEAFISENDRGIDLLQSQLMTNPFYGNKTNWGILEQDEVERFINWLHDNGLEKASLEYHGLVYPGLL